MKTFFSMDGPLFENLNKLADSIILNLLFIVCSIPVITIGASWTALYYTTLKRTDQEEGYVWKTFLRAFRENLKKSTIIWLILLVFAALLWFDYQAAAQMGSLMTALRVAVGIGLLLWVFILLYAFPLTAKFENTVWMTIRNAVLVAVANFPRTLLLIVACIAAVVLTLLNELFLVWGLLVWLLVGFALMAWIQVKLTWPILAVMAGQGSDEGDAPASGSDETELSGLFPDEETSGTQDVPEAPENGPEAADAAAGDDGAPADTDS